jgi:PRC-barrel domain
MRHGVCLFLLTSHGTDGGSRLQNVRQDFDGRKVGSGVNGIVVQEPNSIVNWCDQIRSISFQRAAFLIGTTTMSTKPLLVAIGALLVAVPFAMAQVQTMPSNPDPNANPNQRQDRMTGGAIADQNAPVGERQACKSSELVGLSVRTVKDEEKGKIKDLMIGHDGRVVYAAVSFGGFLGVGDKLFAVPFEAIHVVKNGDKIEFARIDVTEETIKNRQGFNQDRWPDQADQSFLTGSQRNAERPVGGAAPTAR